MRILYSLLFLFCSIPSLFANNNPAREAFSVVHPKPDDVVHASDSTFVFGNFSLPTDSITVNGILANIFPNGTFLAMIPVAPGSLYINTQFNSKSSSFKDQRKVFVPPHLFEIPAENLLIDNEFLYPDRPIAINNGETIAIIAKGTPNAHMYFSLGEERIYRMQQVNKKRRFRWGNSSFGLNRSWALPPVDGVYVGTFTPEPEDAGKKFQVMLTLISNSEQAISLHNANEIYVRAQNKPVIKEVTKKVSLVDYQNRRYFLTYLQPGTSIQTDGGYGEFSRIRLSDSVVDWLSREEIEISPRSLGMEELPGSQFFIGYSENDSDKVSLDIFSKQPVPVQIAQSSNLNYCDLTFLQATKTPDFIRDEHGNPFLHRIAGKMIADDMYRVRFSFANKMVWGYQFEWDERKYSISFNKSPVRKFESESPLHGLIICVDPGHGPDDGAFGLTGITEKMMTVYYARKLQSLLEQKGAHVILTRTEDTGLELSRRTLFAEANNADLFVSLHFNALPNGVNPMKIRGTSTYYFHPHSKPLAKAVHHRMLQQTQLPDKGLHAQNLSVCRVTSMPSILVEPAFIMQPFEEMRILDSDFRDAVCQGICDGIIDFVKEYNE
ncbi:MAG: N-acetylmuramoyl-L-alanine amidase [Deferribacteres bacterium]|nr:N-acetylmuramoyl-L-alanine amidase [Deferribacteres bacterium]